MQPLPPASEVFENRLDHLAFAHTSADAPNKVCVDRDNTAIIWLSLLEDLEVEGVIIETLTKRKLISSTKAQSTLEYEIKGEIGKHIQGGDYDAYHRQLINDIVLNRKFFKSNKIYDATSFFPAPIITLIHNAYGRIDSFAPFVMGVLLEQQDKFPDDPILRILKDNGIAAEHFAPYLKDQIRRTTEQETLPQKSPVKFLGALIASLSLMPMAIEGPVEYARELPTVEGATKVFTAVSISALSLLGAELVSHQATKRSLVNLKANEKHRRKNTKRLTMLGVAAIILLGYKPSHFVSSVICNGIVDRHRTNTETKQVDRAVVSLAKPEQTR